MCLLVLFALLISEGSSYTGHFSNSDLPFDNENFMLDEMATNSVNEHQIPSQDLANDWIKKLAIRWATMGKRRYRPSIYKRRYRPGSVVPNDKAKRFTNPVVFEMSTPNGQITDNYGKIFGLWKPAQIFGRVSMQ